MIPKVFEKYLYQKRSTLLAVGPMSKNCVDATVELSNSHSVPIMLIASRRQIDSKVFGGGYVNGWDTAAYSKYVQDKDKKKLIFLSRDHGGPWQNNIEKQEKFTPKQAMTSAKESYMCDIDAGFKFIHIDTSMSLDGVERNKKKCMDRLFEFYEFCHMYSKKKRKDIFFEIGTEEQSGTTNTQEELEETLNETVEMLRKYNVSVSSHILDVSDKESIEALPQKVIDQHGKVDMVFNNAGVATGSHFKDMEEENWDWVMGINFDGVINSTRAFIPHMIDSPEAAIVNTSSIFGMVAVPGQTVYHATKFAVRGFTESLALEMKETNPNLQIHCVHPGHIGTNIAASARFDEEEFAKAQEEGSKTPSIFSRNAPNSQKEAGDMFREGGMHPSKAAEIILNGVKKNKSRIFVGLDAKLLDLSQRIFPKHYHKTWLLFMPFLMKFRNKKPLDSVE